MSLQPGDAKRRRLQSICDGREAQWLRTLVEDATASSRAIYNVLAKLKNAPIDVAAAAVTESSIREAAASAALGLGHVEMMPCVDNTHRPWYMLDPNRLLMTTLEQSEALQRKFLEVARQRDASWSLLVGFDEYTPGSAFKPESNITCMSLYFPSPSLATVCSATGSG